MPAPAVTRRPGRRRRPAGWVPNHHGAWAMIIVPPILGVILSGPHWHQIPLVAMWWVGYFLFFAAGQWLRSRRKPRFWPATRAYGIAVVVLGAVVALTSPYLVWWAVVFTPLIALTFWFSHRRMDRTMQNDTVTVVAAGLMTPVVYDAGVGSVFAAGWWPTWLITVVVTGYFMSTVFYVKTNIRERGKPTFLVASIAFHGAMTAVAAVFAALWPLSWWHVAVWVALTIRAIAVPVVAARRGTRVSPKTLGIWEIVCAVAIAATVLI